MRFFLIICFFAFAGIILSCRPSGTNAPASLSSQPGTAGRPAAGHGTDLIRIGRAVVEVEFARTEEQREMGLMFRESLATNEGMVFVFDPPSKPAFYMKNTKVPLDILFIDENLKIVDIQQMEAFDEKTLHRPPAAVEYAIEVNRGWAAGHGVRAGDRVNLGTNR